MRESNGAIFNDRQLLEVDRALIETIKQRAREAPVRRFRLCLHHSPDELLQEMIVVHCRDMYSRPHRHPGRTMSYQLIEGLLDVVIFDDEGNVTDSVEMGPADSGKTFCFRLTEDRWYMPVTKSETAVFYEVLSGSNRGGEGTVYAGWSPEPHDERGVAEFLDRVLN